MSSMRPPALIKFKPLQKFFALLYVGIVVGVSIIPQATVITTSFLKTNGPVFANKFSLDSYREVLYRVPKAIVNTFTYAQCSDCIYGHCRLIIIVCCCQKEFKVNVTVGCINYDSICHAGNGARD